MASETGQSRGLWRSRWAAVGAAVAVTLGGGGMVAVNAASSPASSVITIDPVRILDTRDPVNIGLPGPFVSAVSQKLQVTGAVVPAGATGVLLNATVVGPTAAGFLSVRPGDATGAPSTSSLNFNSGDLIPNAVQIGLPTSGANAGQIDITYDAYGQAGPTTEVLIDVVGYMVAGSGAAGPAGPPGPVADRGSITFTGLNATFNPGMATVDPAKGCATLADEGQLFVPLTIPNGATIVAVRVRSFDTVGIPGYPGAADYKLYRVNQGIGETLVASFTSVDGLIDTPMVFNAQNPVSLGNAFYLKVTNPQYYTQQKFCAVTVDYTM